MRDIFLEDVMNKAVTIKVDDKFSKVLKLFREHSIRHLPVVDDKGKLQGLITQRDFHRVTSPRKTDAGDFVYDEVALDKFILRHVMTRNISTLSPEASLYHAADLMIRGKFGCIPVLSAKGDVVGIVTQIDVMKTFICEENRYFEERKERAAQVQKLSDITKQAQDILSSMLKVDAK